MAIQTTPMRVNERSAVRGAGQTGSESRRQFVLGATVVFCWLYFYRPEDFIPGLQHIPMAKIAGILGLVALLVGIMGGSKVKMPRAIKILWLLLLQMTLCIPFAIWRGGAFSTVFDKYAKGVIVAMLISMSVVALREIRKLLWIQVSAVALVTFFSILARHHDGSDRLSGIQKSILENPNDLAINIAISFPLGVAFMLHARGLKKALWAIALIFMSLGIVLTYSRSGLLAFILSVMICVWEYGIKGKRRYLIGIAAAAMLVGVGIAISSSHYRARVESIVLGNIEGSGDKGSLAARKALLKKSIIVAVTHPIFGVGPGCFAVLDKGWVVAHNAYTEMAAESGILALILFLLAMREAFKNLAQARKSQQFQDDPEFRLFTQALRAGLVAYLAGACFASTEYLLYSYLLVAYSCAMVQIANQSVPSLAPEKKGQSFRKSIYDRIPRPQPSWSR